ETPKRTHPAFAHVVTRVIGSNRLSTQAAAAHAKSLGLTVIDNGSVLDGDAARCGAALASSLLERAREGWRGCIVWGGETTVTLDARVTPAHGVASAGAEPPRGGRCQELALSAARVLAEGGDV